MNIVEFCPKCGNPIGILEANDPSRLCSICAWFGDSTETLKKPPMTGNLETSLRQSLALYRSVCRNELLLEAAYKADQLSFGDLLRARAKIVESESSLIALFRGIHPSKQVVPRINGMVPWPDDWTDRHHNGSEQCDMLIGLCSCGAWHYEAETWVQNKLRRHNAIIEPEK